MADVNYTKYGIIGFLVLALGSAGIYTYIQLTPEQISHAYVCTTQTDLNGNPTYGVFDNISSSGKTVYWVDNKTGKISSALCKNGSTNIQWTNLTKYVQSKNLTMDQFLNNGFKTVVPNNISETNIEIIVGNSIIVEDNKQVEINGEIYNITVTKPSIICTSTTGYFSAKDCVNTAKQVI